VLALLVCQAAKVAPRDPDLRKKLAECEKEVKRLRFEEALAVPVGTGHAGSCRRLCCQPDKQLSKTGAVLMAIAV
jgi:hypothetical protein